MTENTENLEIIENQDNQENTEDLEINETPENISSLIEAIIFTAKEPISSKQIIKVLSEEQISLNLGELREIIDNIILDYQNKGINLAELASGYRFQVSNVASNLIAKQKLEKPMRFSRAFLETLALIAYRQPITRSEIEEIRGVAVSTNIVRSLEELGWIKVVGHKDVPGKPALLATTKYFLDHFGLKSLEELPPLAELKPLLEHDKIIEEHIDKAIESEPDNKAEEFTQIVITQNDHEQESLDDNIANQEQ